MGNEALDLARRIRTHTRRVARHTSRPVQIAKVTKADPFAVTLVEGKMVLDEDDLIIPRAVRRNLPRVGDFVSLAQIHTDEYMVLGVRHEKDSGGDTLVPASGKFPADPEDGQLHFKEGNMHFWDGSEWKKITAT